MSQSRLPLLDHPLDQASAFTPEALIAAVRDERGLPARPVPLVCVLDFDGDLTDWLVATGAVQPCPSWACFHTMMHVLEIDGISCAIVPRTIGGPYAVLVAEQLAASGARIVFGLTSAGRVSPSLPVPSLIVATRAIRDEGTSYHYLPPEETVKAQPDVVAALLSEVRAIGLPVSAGLVWTTDAPYRETLKQLKSHAEAGALAVEMQAASLFAFGTARNFPVGVVAHVTNAVGRTEEQFDKGDAPLGFEIFQAICRAGRRVLLSQEGGPDMLAPLWGSISAGKATIIRIGSVEGGRVMGGPLSKTVMIHTGEIGRASAVRRGKRLEYVTVAYNSMEGVIGIGAGLLAGSVALVGFGFDSIIEVTSGAVLLWRLRADVDPARREHVEVVSVRIVGICFLVLALYIAYDSVRMLFLREAPERSLPGIALAIASLVVMPILARAKRRVARTIASNALAADAKQTELCMYLSAILLGGLILNATFDWWWADPAAGLLMIPIIVGEGINGLKGQSCCDDCSG